VKAQKVENGRKNDTYRLSVPNVYEIAVASAREARRLNRELISAGNPLGGSVVQEAISRVVRGDVAYKIEPGDKLTGGKAAAKVDGHT